MARAARVCAKPGCPELVTTGLCDAHRRRADALRGRRQARGYGRDHDRLRAAYVPVVARGLTPCARCGHLIEPGAPWDLGHADADRRLWTGPEHAACNRATTGRRLT